MTNMMMTEIQFSVYDFKAFRFLRTRRIKILDDDTAISKNDVNIKFLFTNGTQFNPDINSK